MDHYKDTLKSLLTELIPISDTSLDIFLNGLKIRKFDKGEVILGLGQVERYLSIVIEGITRHYIIKENDDEVSFDFSFQGDFNSSYASFIQQSPSQFTIESIKPTILASFSHDYLTSLYEKYPASNLFGRVAVEQYFIFREQREISLLTQNASERYEMLIQKYPEYINEVPLKYLASYLNIQPESLSRIRKKLSEKT